MILEFNRNKTRTILANGEIHAISTMAWCRMATKVRRRLRFSWHKEKHAETTTYCALQVRCSLVNDSLFPLTRRTRLTRTSVPRVKEIKLVYADDAKKRKKQRIRTKPSKWTEIINHNSPKTENVWIFENCFRADIHNCSLIGCPWDVVRS